MKKEDSKTIQTPATEPKSAPMSPMYAVISLVLILAVIVAGMKIGVGTQMSIFFGSVVTIIMALLHGTKWSEVQDAALKNIANCAIPLMILILVGMMVGIWLVGGVIPALIYYGLKFISAKAIVPVTFILCALSSIFTGTSLGSIATMGLAMAGVGYSLGVEPALIAGAVASGSLFGDKMSPLSDTTNIAPAMSGTDLYSHIGSMFYTTVPATVITLILYTVLGLKYAGGAYDASSIVLIQDTLAENFNISVVSLLPLIMVLVLSACRVPSVLALSVSILFSVVIVLFVQGIPLSSIMGCALNGYVSTTGVAMVDTILSRGGIVSMVSSYALISFASFMAGGLEASGILDMLSGMLLTFVKSVRSLVIATLIFGWGAVMLTGTQSVGIVLPAKAMGEAYDRLDVHRKVLSRCTEDSATIGAALIPWSVMTTYIMSVLDVDLGYIPYAFLCYLVPVFSIVCAFTGFGIWNSAGEPVWKKSKKKD